MLKIIFQSNKSGIISFIALVTARKNFSGKIHFDASYDLKITEEDFICETLDYDCLNKLPEKSIYGNKDICSYDMVIADQETKFTNNYLVEPFHLYWEIPDDYKEMELNRENIFIISSFFESRLSKLLANDELKTLISQNKIFHNMFNSMSDGIIVQKNGQVFYLNKSAEKILGVNAWEVMGAKCGSIIPAEFCSQYCESCNQKHNLKSKVNVPVQFKLNKSTQYDLEVSLNSLNSADGESLGIIIMLHNKHKHTFSVKKSQSENSFMGIVGLHPSMKEIYETIKYISDINVPVLIYGENGTGKELVANAIHQLGNKKNQPFVPLNCSAIPEGLFESELFGHVKGAFTSAIRDKKGRFELANNGILFLDEIGDIPLPLQVKLLRVLQEKTYYPVGSEKQYSSSARIICATNRNLPEMMEKGFFREDLFYRLNVVPIKVPPLRKRRSDIPLLLDYYIQKYCKESKLGYKKVDSHVLDLLYHHNWPGNVRELANAIHYALIHSRGNTVKTEHLPAGIFQQENIETRGRKRKLNIDDINSALKKYDGNKVSAAEFLGISRTTLYRYLENFK